MALDIATFESLIPSRYITFTIPNPSLSTHLLRVAVIDSPVRPTEESPRVAAMFVPENREHDWIFCTQSGLLQLLFNSPGISRLILVGNQVDTEPRLIYKRLIEVNNDRKRLEERIKPLLLALSPKSCFKMGVPEVPIFSYEDSVVCSVVVDKCVGRFVGEMLVEDAEIESESRECSKREFRRRMRFKRMPNLVQTEIRIVPGTDCGSNCVGIGDTRFDPDLEILVHPYLAPMVASLSLISWRLEEKIRVGVRPKALCVGVGGGALLSFLKTQLDFEVTGVEVDEEVLKIARKYFGLEDDRSIPVFLGDAVEVLGELVERPSERNLRSFDTHKAKKGSFSSFVDVANPKFDVIMVDLDSSDAITGTCAPPLEFVKKHVFLAVKSLLYDHGILAMNVIPPNRLFYETLKSDFWEVFPELYEINVGNGDNYILIAAASFITPFIGNLEDDFLKKLRRVISGVSLDCIEKIKVQ